MQMAECLSGDVGLEVCRSGNADLGVVCREFKILKKDGLSRVSTLRMKRALQEK